MNTSDPRKNFEQLQMGKLEIDQKIRNGRFSEAMININKLLTISCKFYQEDHIFVKEFLFKQRFKN